MFQMFTLFLWIYGLKQWKEVPTFSYKLTSWIWEFLNEIKKNYDKVSNKKKKVFINGLVNK